MNSVQTVHKTVHYTRKPALCRDLTSMSRHQGIQNHVATSNQCRDTTQASPGRNLKMGSRHRFSYPVPSLVATSLFQVATSWSFTYVATSFPCRDLPHCRPCRDIKSMSRLQFPTGQVATSVPCRDLLETNLCCDIIFMSRPHSSPQWDFQVATPKSMSRPPLLPPMSRPQH